MIGVRENDLGVHRPKFIGVEGFDARKSANRHEHRRFDGAAWRVKDPRARPSVRRENIKLKTHRLSFSCTLRAAPCPLHLPAAPCTLHAARLSKQFKE